MNGVAVLLCVAALGVDHNWRTTQEGQLEYVLQIEPTFIPSLEQGQAVTSKLPATAKEVHRLCLRIGKGDLQKAPQRMSELPPLPSAEKRAAQPEVDTPVAVVVDAQGQTAETTDVSHGWQAVGQDQVDYVVQLAPQLLSSLREGDEIYMNLYPEAGSIQQFTVVAGQAALPRETARPRGPFAAREHKASVPAAENPAAYARTGAETETAPAADARTGEHPRFRPATSRFNVSDNKTTEQSAEAPNAYFPAAEERTGQSAPELFATEPNDPPPAYGAAPRGPIRPAADHPGFESNQLDRRKFETAAAAPAKGRDQTMVTPPFKDTEYLRPDEERKPAPKSRFGEQTTHVAPTAAETDAEDDKRLASRDTKLTTAGTVAKVGKPGSTAAADEPKPYLPLFFACCALFLSIGGNLYLGWTAAEFYSRYRMALGRMRGEDKESDRE